MLDNPKALFYLYKSYYYYLKKQRLFNLAYFILEKFILPIYEKYLSLNTKNNKQKQMKHTIINNNTSSLDLNYEKRIKQCINCVINYLNNNILNLNYEEDEMYNENEDFSDVSINVIDYDDDEGEEEIYRQDLIESINVNENESGISDLENEINEYKSKKENIFHISKVNSIVQNEITELMNNELQSEIYKPLIHLKPNLNYNYYIKNTIENEQEIQDESTSPGVRYFSHCDDDAYNKMKDPYSTFNKYKKRPKKYRKEEKAFRKTVPFLRDFNLKFLKKENIDKKIFRKFRNYIKEQYYNKTNNEIKTLFSYNRIFWKDFVKNNLLPPMKYLDLNTNTFVEFKSFNTNYFIWLFNQNGTKDLFDFFALQEAENIVDGFIREYDLDKEIDGKVIIEKIKQYIYLIPTIYVEKKVDVEEKSIQCSEEFKEEWDLDGGKMYQEDEYEKLSCNLNDYFNIRCSELSISDKERMFEDEMF